MPYSIKDLEQAGRTINAHFERRAVLRLALKREVLPVIGNALFNEYESLLKPDNLVNVNGFLMPC